MGIKSEMTGWNQTDGLRCHAEAHGPGQADLRLAEQINPVNKIRGRDVISRR